MLVSIKCQLLFEPIDAKVAYEAMEARAETSGLKKALCLLIVFGSNPDFTQFTGDIAIDHHAAGQVVSQLVKEGGIVTKAVRVPHKFAYGLTTALLDMTLDAQVNSELFSSHSFLMAHDDATHESLSAENAIGPTSSTMICPQPRSPRSHGVKAVRSKDRD